MAKNAFLTKQKEMNQLCLDVGMDTGFQKCWDLIQIVLHDPNVMGKDTFGQERIKKLYTAMQVLEKQLRNAWIPNTEKDADVCQRDLDALLGEIWKEDLCKFYDRYPYVKKPDYSRGKKNWR